jgi:hypothetical protein
VVIVLATRLNVEVSNPAEDGFLWTIKIRSTTSFGEEIKPSAPCSKILRLLNILAEYGRDTS